MQQITEPELLFQSEKIYKTRGANQLVGNNINKGAVVVYTDSERERLNETEWNKLLEILKACKLKEEDVAFVNAARQAVTFSSLRKQITCGNIIVFGEVELSRNLQLKKFHLFEIDGVKILKSEPVSKLLNNEADRVTLWKLLRKMFDIIAK